MTATDRPWIVLYDSDCGFCKWALTLVLARDRGHVLRPLALGTPEADALLGDLTPAERLSTWHLVAPDGTRTSGGAAAPPMLRAMHRAEPLARLLGAFPRATDRGYRWVADHRSLLSRAVPSRAKRGSDAAIRRHAELSRR